MQATPRPLLAASHTGSHVSFGKDWAAGEGCETRGTRAESRVKEGEEGRGEEQRGEGRWENREEEKGRKTQGEGAGEEGVCTGILVGVNICCSACQGSIYRDGLTPGPLVEY